MQWVAVKDEPALVSFHEAGFFRELQWKRINHDKMDEKAIDGWFQFDYVLDLAKETRMNMSLSVYRAAIFRRLPKEMVSSFLQNRLPGKWLPIALGRQHC